MMTPTPTLLLIIITLVLAILLPSPSLALFQDTAGLNDWYKQHVGRPVSARLVEETLLVETDKGVLAGLDVATGDVKWRRVLQDEVMKCSQGVGDAMVVATNKFMRYVSVREGKIRWETPLTNIVSGDIQQCHVVITNTVPSEIFVMVEGTTSNERWLIKLDRTAGTMLWKVMVTNKLTTPSTTPIYFSVCKDVVMVGDGVTSIVLINKSTGKVTTQRTIPGNTHIFGMSGCTVLANTPDAMVSYSPNGDDTTTTTITTRANLHINMPWTVTRLPSGGDADVTITFGASSHQQVLMVNASTGVNVFPTMFRGSDTIFDRSDNGMALALSRSTGEVTITTNPIANLKLVSPRPASQRAHAAWLLSSSHILVLYHDGCISLYSGQHRVWSREEGLASVLAVVSTSLPRSALHNPGANRGAPSSLERFTQQLSHLSSLFSGMAGMFRTIINETTSVAQKLVQGNSLASVLKGPSVQSISEEEMERFGFSLVLVFLTKETVFGLDSETAEVLWVLPLSANMQRKPAVFELRHMTSTNGNDPEVLILDSESGEWIVISSVSGKIVERGVPAGFAGPVAQVITLDEDNDEGERKHLLLIASDGSTTIIPLIQDSASLVRFQTRLAARLPHMFAYMLKDNILSGFAFNASQTIAPEFGGIVGKPTYRIVFPEGGVRVSAIAVPPRPDPVSSPARTLGDGNVLIKWINPNLAAVMTTPIDGSSGLKLNLIDVVTGHVIHRVSHKDGEEPVHVVRFENWVVYSFWNSKTRRTEISSVCIYEKMLDKRALNPWTKKPISTSFSSFDPVPGVTGNNVATSSSSSSSDLIILQRTFFMSGFDITALSSTTTRRGIANKNVLIGLGGTGQVVMMDQHFLDPRRTSTAPTPEEIAEGLTEYKPELPIVPTHVLSYFKGAARVSFFYVAPARMESTSHVVAIGLDIFKGRASPSGGFDMLSEDFNFQLLTLLITGATIGVLLLKRGAEKKALRDAWL